MIAVKDNRQYTIAQADTDYYQSQGFDILDDAGNVLSHGAGKTVAYSNYAALQAAYDALKAEHDALKNAYAELEAAVHAPPAADQPKARGKTGGDK